MKKLLLLICSCLIAIHLPAQEKNFLKGKNRQQTEVKETKERIKAKKNLSISTDSINALKLNQLKSKVNNEIALRKINLMQEDIAMIDTLLLDEVITEGIQKRTYTYNEMGRRALEKIYDWDNEWKEVMTIRYDYRYDDSKRCTLRAIYESHVNDSEEIEVSRLEISYQGGNRYYKNYQNYGEDHGGLLITYEEGYDSKGRSILDKYYYWNSETQTNELQNWRENKYDSNGEEIMYLYQSGDYGNKWEAITSGLTTEEYDYEWDSEISDWKLTEKDILIVDNNQNELSRERISYDSDGDINYHYKEIFEYNANNRITSEIHYDYDSTGAIEDGYKSEYTYDNYNRISSELYLEYENGGFINEYKAEYTYWGTEKTSEEDEEDFEGPLLTYYGYEWENGTWVSIEKLEITRNANGVPTTASSEYWDEMRVNDEYVDVIYKTTGTFNSVGNIASANSEIYSRNGNTLLGREKEEYEYDSSNRRTLWRIFSEENSQWVIIEENMAAYDAEGREVLYSYRYKYDNRWEGSKTVIVYKNNTEENTHYSINSITGDFNTNPSRFSSYGTLDNGMYEDIHIDYNEESGKVTYGTKDQQKQDENYLEAISWRWDVNTESWYGVNKVISNRENIRVSIPEPEYYDDEIGEGLDGISNAGYEERYEWENNDWVLIHRNGFVRESNGDISYINQHGEVVERTVYSFDSEGRLFKVVNNDGFTTIYNYNSDGMVGSIDRDGTITTYKYSIYQYLGLDEEEISAQLIINGYIITSNNEKAILKAYSLNGSMVATGVGSITVAEKGIYIVVTDNVIQKIVIR